MIQLDDYQLDAISRMHNGCILCGGVGSGKSRTALAYFYQLCGGDLYSGDCFVKPKKAPNLYIITTAKKRDSLEWEHEMTTFLMSSWAKVIVDSWNNIEKYRDICDSYFIFDEQRVVGYGTWSRTFIRIAYHNSWILLSATPGDTWSDYIPVFIANGFYRNKTEFVREHIVYKRFCNYPKVDHYVNLARLVRLRNITLVMMDYNNEITKTHMDIYVDYDKQEYMKIIKTRQNPETGLPIETASEFCLSLRRVVNSDESRFFTILELLDDHPRIIIFYNYDYELDILRRLANITNVAEWNGHKHQPVPDDENWVYLVQYNAGAEGWNCTRTDTVVFYSMNYSYKIMEQAAGRIDRRNTPYKELFFYHLKSRSSIDNAIEKAIRNKKKFNEQRYAESYEEPFV